MCLLLIMVLLCVSILAEEYAFTLDKSIVPTPLERDKELVKSNKEVLYALSSYLPSYEEFQTYYFGYAQALVHLDQCSEFKST